MNRRILLIDSDPTFRTNLTVAVQKYRLEVIHQPDADEAIAYGATEPPALLVVGVEEPEKHGFKVFQRLKKGPLSKVPIMLVTATVAAESFQKHKGLKTHAEEYLDKRQASKEQLAASVDALIGLGEPADDDLDIPVEVDDINVGDGNVIEEDAPDDFDNTALGGPDGRVDASVAEDVDDAFAGLMGGDDVPAFEAAPPRRPTPIPEVVPQPPPVEEDPEREFEEVQSTRADSAATLEALRSAKSTEPPPLAPPEEPARDDRNEVSVVDSIPVGIIQDGGRRDDDDFDDFSKEAPNQAYAIDDVIASKDMIPVESLAAEAVVKPGILESQPAIQLDVDDVEVLGEHDVVIDDDDSGGVPEPVPHPRSAEDAAEAAVVQAKPKFESSPSIDLGLDKIADDADKEQQSGSYPRATSETERDQSGVYDRRALRKIGELERQIAQLKTELDRARATAESAAKGGGREQTFLNLREKMMAADNELKKVRVDLAARDNELADLQARFGAAQAFEGKASELERQVAAEAARAAAAAKKEQELQASIKGLEAELGEKSDAFVQVEKARAQLEQDLANERAMRASSASDAERQLRVEREQLVARQQGELQALRQELQGKHDAALAQLRNELDQQHAGSVAAAIEATRGEVSAEAEQAIAQLEAQRETDLAALRSEHASALDRLRSELGATASERDTQLQTLRAEHAAALERQRAELAAEIEQQRDAHTTALEQHADAIEQQRAEHEAAVAALRGEHAAAITTIRGELEGNASRTRGDLEQQLAQVKTEYETLLAHTKSEYESKLARTQRELEAQLADAHAQIDSANASHEQALAEQASAHASELANQANQHAAVMAARERELTTARQDDAIAHTAALAELKAELDKTIAQHGIKLDGARRELDEAIALQERNKAEILEEQKAAQARLAQEHAEELARVEADKQRAAEDVQRAAAEHRAAMERIAEQHNEELRATREAADREVAELRQVLLGAKRQMEEATHKHQAERAELDKAHEQALSEQKAQHERAMAVANGEIIKVKAVADSEHNRAMAALKADIEKERKDRESSHAAVVKDLTTERDELTRGLSAARDTIKRSEGELASAVQTIADRNAELRGANAAIAERDGRINELRKEIEAIEQENANYQEQVLRAYQKIKADEAMVARAKKAMAIALTVLDDQGAPKTNES
jgi:CheY-like chemotaxis protein